MDKLLEIKLKGMFWDLPDSQRRELLKQIRQNPVKAFQEEEILIRGLNSLNWYDLIQILGNNNLFSLLSENVIRKLYPHERQVYYKNAKELLSKYTLPLTRQCITSH